MKLMDRPGADPRLRLSDVDLLEASSFRALPLVAQPRRATDGMGLALGVLGALAIGALTFVSLANKRTAPPPAPPAAVTVEQEAASEPLPVAPSLEVEPTSEMDAAPMDAAQSQAMPMVLDNTALQGPTATTREAATNGTAPSEGGEAFALSVGGSHAGPARAVRPGNLSTTIVEGTIIPAVLETALNTDLPGNARAIVSRDVRGFDGANVLVPRGSRLVGQYRSATAGQSRAFIVWSRLIRPDGVSIDLASPAVDATGAMGVGGEVDRHFMQRFGSALLLSVVGVLPAIADAASPTVVIGTNTPGQSAAGQAMQSDGRIAPTIRVPIGTPIQVFTARDLAFD